MNIVEHNDAQFTKEKDDLERYLMRIIQRYFDIEQQHSLETTEAIVVESLTRLKRTLLRECKFIFNLNGEAGNVTLTIQKLGGEPAFEKNTAFNKDFGKETDTICEGNDRRLSNKRKPLPHVHEIADVEGLKELLEQLVISPVKDVHANQNVLDMLTYSGKRTEIDLIELEFLEDAISRYYENLEYLDREIKSIHKKKTEDFVGYKNKILEYLERAKVIVQTASSWLSRAKEYVDLQTEDTKVWYKSLIRKFITKDQLREMEEYFGDAIQFITDGWIPLHDGSLIFNQKEDTGTMAGGGDGDSLQKIFDEGVRMGNDDWIWDNTKQSFVYQHNEESSYPLFLSLSKFQDYTHRVTLASTNGDNDGIGVIITYDEETKRHLSLLVHTGGLGYSKPQAGIILNYMESGYGSGYAMKPVDNTLLKEIYATGTGWSGLSKGVSVMIKRKGNNIKIWLKYNQEHGWEVTDKDITIEDTPLFDFNLGDYPELSCFMDKECKYGYGCFSQPQATFLDVFFASYTNYIEPFGETIVDQQTHEEITIPDEEMNNVESGRVKMWFYYDKDGATVKAQLPYLFLTENNSWGVVQGTYDEAGHINIDVNLALPVLGLITSSNFYDDRTIIIPIRKKNMKIGETLEEIQKGHGRLFCINDSDKLDFARSLMNTSAFYWVTNTDNLQYTSLNDMRGKIYVMDKYGSLLMVNNLYGKYGYIAEYKVKYLSEYFTNPRIYYQVYGEKRC